MSDDTTTQSGVQTPAADDSQANVTPAPAVGQMAPAAPANDVANVPVASTEPVPAESAVQEPSADQTAAPHEEAPIASEAPVTETPAENSAEQPAADEQSAA